MSKPQNTEVNFSFLARANTSVELELFYTTQDSVGFNETQKLVYTLPKTSDFEPVELILPIQQLPKNIRLDLAKKNEVKTIELRDFTLEFNQHIVHFENEDLGNFFLPNEYVKMNSPGNFELHSVQNRFDPYISSTPYFAQRLKIEF